MKRRDFCKALALTAAAAACPRASAATPVPLLGRAVYDAVCTLRFRSELSGADLEHTVAYSDGWFEHSALEYDHALALASLGLVTAAFNTAASDARYWVAGEVGREANLADAYEAFGYADPVFYAYDCPVGEAGDFVGHALARKTLLDAGRRTTLVALTLRGGGYGGEWASNLHVGTAATHAGFVLPVDEVMEHLRAYLTRAAAQTTLGTIKLWVGGYSRGGAVANILAARIRDELPELATENVFVYTFAAPAALTAESHPAHLLDFNNVHDDYLRLRADWAPSNVWNIVSSGDLVPRVMPQSWGFYRNGNDRFLPATHSLTELAALDERGASFGPTALVFDQLARAEDTDGVLLRLSAFFIDQKNFHALYEAAFMDMVQCAFLRSQAEVEQGVLLTDAEIVVRLRSLSNMERFDDEKIQKSVRTASSMSRAVLERLGDTLPVRARQIVIPVLAVGLCYGIDRGVAASAARYIAQFLSARPDSADVVIRAAFCHHPENYIALMEYYPPAVHTLKASTRPADPEQAE